ncbi:MAG: RNA polymerase sigma-70 factor [Daejeonella sp.]
MINLEALSNDELLGLLRSNDQAAFKEIYRRYWQTLYAVAYNRLRNQQKSEDAVHDVLSSLWGNRHKSEIGNLAAYLATAVKFRVLENTRKEFYKQKYIQDRSISHPEESHDIAEALHYKRLLQALHEEVENLPERCKLVFKYSREENMPLKQIAAEMNLSTSTVENHLNRALKRLKEVVKKLGGQILSVL